MIDLPAGRHHRPVVIVMLVVVALLLCAIFMPAMAMAALLGCAVATLVMTQRVRAPDRAFDSTTAPFAARPAFRMTRGTGPPIVTPLRT